MRFFWNDIAANWFEPAQRLGGAHGRDYAYLTGRGALDLHLQAAGWIPTPDSKKPSFHVFENAVQWNPPEEAHRKAIEDIPRFVFHKWGPSDTEWTSQQVGRHFSIGVAGSGRGPEDKPFALNLAGPNGPMTVMINFFMDGRGDPYGSKKIPTGASGHSKAHHLAPIFRAVQNGANVLFVASWSKGTSNYSKKTPAAECLYSHMDIPAEAEVWFADRAADLKAPSQPIPGNLCFLRMGDVAVGLRVLLAINTDGQPVTAELVNDGEAFHARRLSVTHSTEAPGDKRGTVAIAACAEEGLNDAGFSAFRKKFAELKTVASIEASVVQVAVEALPKKLLLKTDITTGAVLETKGADAMMQVAPTSVNGIPLTF